MGELEVGSGAKVTLSAVPGLRVGHAEVPGGGSGCTVVLGPFRGAVEVRGMATGSRELDVLSPLHLVEEVHALLLTGGSAFGLDAAGGVMAWLEERGMGFEAGTARVPLVPAAVIFDLAPGVGRPGPGEGRRACEAASRDPVPEGPVGAGAGARVGRLLGPERSTRGGVGSASVPWGGGTVGALAVVNALGDVLRPDGSVLAGVRGEDGGQPRAEALLMMGESAGAFGAAGAGAEDLPNPRAGTNTTLGVVATDLPLSRVDLARLARMASGAFPRAVSPAGTPFDGDIVFALSTAEEKRGALAPAELMALGVVARDLLESAIRRAVAREGREEA